MYNKKEPEAEGDAVDAERLLQRLLVKLLRFNCITRHTDEVCPWLPSLDASKAFGHAAATAAAPLLAWLYGDWKRDCHTALQPSCLPAAPPVSQVRAHKVLPMDGFIWAHSMWIFVLTGSS